MVMASLTSVVSRALLSSRSPFLTGIEELMASPKRARPLNRRGAVRQCACESQVEGEPKISRAEKCGGTAEVDQRGEGELERRDGGFQRPVPPDGQRKRPPAAQGQSLLARHIDTGYELAWRREVGRAEGMRGQKGGRLGRGANGCSHSSPATLQAFLPSASSIQCPSLNPRQHPALAPITCRSFPAASGQARDMRKATASMNSDRQSTTLTKALAFP
jgi:hypothetical protein